MPEIRREFVFKIVLCGEGGVGKTSIRSKFMGVGFKSDYIKTIGADFASKAVTIGENMVHFQIWDLAGQKMYRHVRSSFYSGCKCGFLVFDLTDIETLEKLELWVKEAIENSGGFLKIFIVLGNKHDLKDQIKVKQADVNKLIDKLNKMEDIKAAYLETSAKTGENINEAFNMMGKMFLEKEGFPCRGEVVEINKKALEEDCPENIPLISIANNPKKFNEKEKDEEIDLSNLNQDEVQNIVKTIVDKINQLTEITVALEERILHIETQKESGDTTSDDILKIKGKIDNLEQQLEKFSIVLDKKPISQIETTQTKGNGQKQTILVPSIDELGISTKKDEKTVAEVIDSKAIKPMEIVSKKESEQIRDKIIENVTKKKENERETLTQKVCPKCANKLAYIKQYNRWYCYHCKLYV